VHVRLLLGPAGSGKTHRCLAEIRRELELRPEGPPLVLLAPKQATFQLERQLLAEGGVAAYTRLRIVSFERLADFVCEKLGAAAPRVVSEQERLMVLRAILLREAPRLGIYRASAGRPGFARELSLLLRELQQHRVAPDALTCLAGGRAFDDPLGGKLQDLALLLQAYTDWLRHNGSRDADHQLEQASQALRKPGPAADSFLFGGVWLDAFSELTPGERWLLLALVPHTPSLTITFCLESESAADAGWLSAWSPIAKLYRDCHGDFAGRRDVEIRVETLPSELGTQELGKRSRRGVETGVETLPRSKEVGRFTKSPMLAHLERHWEDGRPFEEGAEMEEVALYEAATPEQEAVLACREIRRFAHSGGRYRDAAVLLRRMEVYEDVLPPLLDRYEIPYFIDRRESLARHPLAALTHYVLRLLTHGWELADLFGAWKTGFFPVGEEEIDRLENEALARGWRGNIWRSEPPRGTDREEPGGAAPIWKKAELEKTRQALVRPLEELEAGLPRAAALNGPALAGALGRFWDGLGIESRLAAWDQEENRGTHLAAWREMQAWRETLALAFADQELPLAQWLMIAEAGLAGLTAGTIPPALDQVLIGAIDRSRNPDLQLAIVLGLNEGVFPLAPPAPKLLTELDRDELGAHQLDLPGNRRHFLGRERFLGYIAFTRARQRLVLARPMRDLEGETLNPSPFFSRVQALFPRLRTRTVEESVGWENAEHPSELLGQALREEREFAGGGRLSALAHLPAMKALHERLPLFRAMDQIEPLPGELVAQVFGPEMRTSISTLQRFAACPFQFFAHHTLGGRERALFELNARERGSFFHEVVAEYHRKLAGQGRKWREVAPEEARHLALQTAAELSQTFRHGLLRAGASARFSADMMSEEIAEFIAVETSWMSRCAFDPWKAEARFGEAEAGDAGMPAWRIGLAGGRAAVIEGKIDRVDTWRDPVSGKTHAVVIDYKSRGEKLDDAFMNHGVAMQLPAYLNALTRAAHPETGPGLEPAGMFYAPLHPSSDAEPRRNARGPDDGPDEELFKAFQFRGRFAAERLEQLDREAGPGSRGSHFAFHIKKGGAVSEASGDAVPAIALQRLLDQNAKTIREIAERIYEGEAGLDPWKKGGKTACDTCDCRPVCRMDPWTQTFRSLAGPPAGETPPD
jgi:ATP-dependent helicase/nuclease subunit B